MEFPRMPLPPVNHSGPGLWKPLTAQYVPGDLQGPLPGCLKLWWNTGHADKATVSTGILYNKGIFDLPQGPISFRIWEVQSQRKRKLDFFRLVGQDA